MPYKNKTKRVWGQCLREHVLTPDNTYTWTDRAGVVHRKCRTCTLDRAKQRRIDAKNGDHHG